MTPNNPVDFAFWGTSCRKPSIQLQEGCLVLRGMALLTTELSSTLLKSTVLLVAPVRGRTGREAALHTDTNGVDPSGPDAARPGYDPRGCIPTDAMEYARDMGWTVGRWNGGDVR